MPNFQYNDVSVKINHSGVLANNASIVSKNNVETAYLIGRATVRAVQFPNYIAGPIQNSASIDYVLQTNYDPAFNVITRVKRTPHRFYDTVDTMGDVGEQLDIGGISGEGYLTNYSLSVEQYSPVTVNTSYAIFSDFSGSLGSKTVDQNYSPATISGLGHGYTTFVTGPNNYVTGKVYSLNYTCNLNWRPVYILGRKTPAEVIFLNGGESISLVRDIYTGVQFSGQSLTGYFGFSDVTVDFYGLGYLNGNNSNLMQIPMSGFIIKNTDVSISENDWVRIKIDAERMF